MLTPGEITVGMFVTVLENKPCRTEQFPDEISALLSGEMPRGDVMVKNNEDRSGQGNVLKVVAVQLPYVVTIEPEDSFFKDHPITRDTRLTVFMELKPEFIAAFQKSK